MLAATLPVFRFAPSPNGRLHLGHAYSALLNESLARKTYGRLLLRMEDIDTTRCTPAFAKECLADLSWLGIAWEEPVRTQSRHSADYTAALTWLKERGLVYPCFCTRTEIASASTAQDPDGAPLYPGTCTHLTQAQSRARIEAGTPHSWRLHMSMALLRCPAPHTYSIFDPITMRTQTISANPALWGDAILARKDIKTSYHLSVTFDDALQNITHIVRGQDLEAATSLHTLLQALFGFDRPHYHHHALIKEGGQKLSKSKGSESIADLRAQGVTPAQIRNLLAI